LAGSGKRKTAPTPPVFLSPGIFYTKRSKRIMKSLVAKRVCLSCNKLFKSSGPWNRRCSLCKKPKLQIDKEGNRNYKEEWCPIVYKYPVIVDGESIKEYAN
jgi:hypothetical protein